MRSHLLLVVPSALLLAACTGTGTFGGGGGGADDDDDAGGARPLDTSAVGDGALFVAYAGGLRVQGWGGEATFSVEAGALPSGLALAASGAITGTPDWLGTSTFTVRATGLPFPDSVGDVTIAVVPGDTAVQLGFARDQLNNMVGIGAGRLMTDPWVRIEGGGETGMSVTTITPGLYAPGPNGEADEGDLDDVLVGAVDPADVVVAVQDWWSDPEWDAADPVTNDGLTFTAHGDTGRLRVTLTHPDWPPLSVRVLAVPPDWCPLGEHPGGGWTPGQCE